jgi:hypothetical protein
MIRWIILKFDPDIQLHGKIMLAAEDSAKLSSIVDEVRTLKERVDTLEEQLQALIDLHTKAYEIREDYLEHLDEIEQKGDFVEFSDIGDLKRLIEEEENCV